jgi:hypothetical protein
LNQELVAFKDSGYLAQQIVIDKPQFWEFKLTAELLRYKLKPLVSRWHSLEQGHYSKALVRIPPEDAMDWFRSRNRELLNLVRATDGIVNSQMSSAWGPPGVPGSDAEILLTCDLLAEACQGFLNWEEAVRFVLLPSSFDDLQTGLIGVAGRFIDKVTIIPSFISEVFSQDDPRGKFEMTVKLDLPEGWVEKMQKALERAVNG